MFAPKYITKVHKNSYTYFLTPAIDFCPNKYNKNEKKFQFFPSTKFAPKNITKIQKNLTPISLTPTPNFCPKK